MVSASVERTMITIIIFQCNRVFRICDAEQRIQKKKSLDIARTLWYCVVSRKGTDRWLKRSC